MNVAQKTTQALFTAEGCDTQEERDAAVDVAMTAFCKYLFTTYAYDFNENACEVLLDSVFEESDVEDLHMVENSFKAKAVLARSVIDAMCV